MANTTASGRSALAASGIDGLAIKPTETDVAALARGTDRSDAAVASLADAPVDTVVVDFEGHEVMPAADALAVLADGVDALRITTPVRADGFDPLGDDGETDRLPADAGRVLVAGHPAYLSDDERRRAIAPRLRAAVDAAVDPWVGTEGIERLALAAGGTQFELLGPTVERDVRALRAAGFDGEVAVYAPTVLGSEEDAILDAVGDYVARRGAVAETLPEDASTDARATGEARTVLLEAARDYALVGDVATVRERTGVLREAGVDRLVGYPAAGLASLVD